MTSEPHPLTQLNVAELPGWISAMRFAAGLTPRLVGIGAGPLILQFTQLREIAEGLLANADAAEQAAEEEQRGLADAVAQEGPVAARVAIEPRDKPGAPRPPGRPPRSSRGPVPVVWTPERVALFTEIWPTLMPPEEVLSRLNALPGIPVSGLNAMHQRALKTPLRREGLPIPERFRPAPAAPLTPVLGIPEEDKAEARQMVLAGRGARDLVEEFGWDLAQAQDFAQQVRDDAREAA